MQPVQIETIAVGSKNPAKLRAVTNAVQKVWPNATIASVAAPSGVREQPLDDDEAIQGAVNRALFSRLALDADLGMGLEGSVSDTAYGMFLCGWVAVVDRSFTYSEKFRTARLSMVEATSLNADISAELNTRTGQNFSEGQYEQPSVPVDLIQSTVRKHAGISIGCTGQMLLPASVAAEIRTGSELGPLMDQLTRQHNTKNKLGTNGILTNGLVQRGDSFEQGVILALARYISPHYYEWPTE